MNSSFHDLDPNGDVELVLKKRDDNGGTADAGIKAPLLHQA